MSQAFKKITKRDTVINLRNAQAIFKQAFAVITEEIGGREKLIFPKEIMWLGGAPGSGKGTNTPSSIAFAI